MMRLLFVVMVVFGVSGCASFFEGRARAHDAALAALSTRRDVAAEEADALALSIASGDVADGGRLRILLDRVARLDGEIGFERAGRRRAVDGVRETGRNRAAIFSGILGVFGLALSGAVTLAKKRGGF